MYQNARASAELKALLPNRSMSHKAKYYSMLKFSLEKIGIRTVNHSGTVEDYYRVIDILANLFNPRTIKNGDLIRIRIRNVLLYASKPDMRNVFIVTIMNEVKSLGYESLLKSLMSGEIGVGVENSSDLIPFFVSAYGKVPIVNAHTSDLTREDLEKFVENSSLYYDIVELTPVNFDEVVEYYEHKDAKHSTQLEIAPYNKGAVVLFKRNTNA